MRSEKGLSRINEEISPFAHWRRMENRLLEYRENPQRNIVNRHSSGFGWPNHFDGPPRFQSAFLTIPLLRDISHGKKGPKGFDNSGFTLPPPLLLSGMLSFASQPIERDTRFNFREWEYCFVYYFVYCFVYCNIPQCIGLLKYCIFYLNGIVLQFSDIYRKMY